MTRIAIGFKEPPSDMAQEEIARQISFLGRDVTFVRFAGGGAVLEVDAPADQAERVTAAITDLAGRVRSTLRSVQRKVVARTPGSGRPLPPHELPDGVRFEADGLASLEGMPLALFEYFDRAFEELGATWSPRRFRAPTLIPTRVLARCDYLSSYPHNLTYACHLPEDTERIADFRARHLGRDSLDERDVAEMVPPEVCLSPAACYHVYYANRDSVVPPEGRTYGLVGKCFRYEARNLLDLRRLWDFTLREVVFLGAAEQVLAERERAIELVREFLVAHELAAEIRTASDPFFVAPDAGAKAYFQLAWDTKFEVSLLLPDDARLAVASLNYNADFFGRVFNVRLGSGEPMYSACVGFGIERWVYGFLAQHGSDPARWPDLVRRAPELAG